MGDGTAKEGEHYEAQEGELIFCNEETTKTISLDHGCHLLGVPGRVLHCPCRKPGLLCDHLLPGSSVCHPHPFGKTTSCCGWRARWTQDLQNNFIFPLRLLLVFLRHDLRSGDVRRH